MHTAKKILINVIRNKMKKQSNLSSAHTLETRVIKRLRQARINAGYKTAKEFSVLNNLPISTYSLHESGMRSMSLNVIEKYAQILDVNVVQLFI